MLTALIVRFCNICISSSILATLRSVENDISLANRINEYDTIRHILSIFPYVLNSRWHKGTISPTPRFWECVWANLYCLLTLGITKPYASTNIQKTWRKTKNLITTYLCCSSVYCCYLEFKYLIRVTNYLSYVCLCDSHSDLSFTSYLTGSVLLRGNKSLQHLY